MRTYTRTRLRRMTTNELITVCLLVGADRSIKLTDSRTDLINHVLAAQSESATN